jgi:hypothetical protein
MQKTLGIVLAGMMLFVAMPVNASAPAATHQAMVAKLMSNGQLVIGEQSIPSVDSITQQDCYNISPVNNACSLSAYVPYDGNCVQGDCWFWEFGWNLPNGGPTTEFSGFYSGSTVATLCGDASVTFDANFIPHMGGPACMGFGCNWVPGGVEVAGVFGRAAAFCTITSGGFPTYPSGNLVTSFHNGALDSSLPPGIPGMPGNSVEAGVGTTDGILISGNLF